MPRPSSLLLSSAAAFFVATFLLAAELATPPRKPWTTSRFTGSPDPPPPYKIVRAFPNLKFDRPVLMARCPGSDRLFVGDQSHVLHSFPNRPDATASVFFDLQNDLKTLHLHPDAKRVEALYGLVFHPDFQRNRECFVCYTLSAKEPRARNLEDGSRVSRFKVTDTDPPRIDPDSEEIVLTFPQGGHNGGDLHFGPDGMLYISTGDATSPNPPDALNTGQDISDLLSSVLRIDVNRRDPGRNYAVPADNPFVSLAGARPEVWAYGFRNPWRMSFDRETGHLFVGDVGWELWEMVHRIERGGNYGWSATEGPQPIKPERVGPTPIHPALIELSHAIACSVTGGYVYRGKNFPELRGAYVFGDWETRRIWAARFDGDKVREMPEITPPAVRMSSFGEDNDGELYIVDHDNGTLHTLERNDAGAQNVNFPTCLSDTGLFASLRDNAPAAGIVPYEISSRQWLDGATSQHWAAFPGDSHATYYAAGKPIPGLVYWHNFRMHFPKDAVLVKNISFEGRRLETQILHYDGLDWRPYAYAWRDDQSDADLVPAEGGEKEISLAGASRVWQFHSRTQCMSCHSNQSEYALGFLPEQLNRPANGSSNQLVTFTEMGLIRRAEKSGDPLPPFDAAAAAREKKVTDPTDETAPLQDRARGYLHANCGHCHSDHGGGAVALRLHHAVANSGLNAIGVRPARGDFGLPDAAIIKPGDPLASTLYFRMAKFGRDRMPHIGSEFPDESGLALVEKWIASLAEGEAGRVRLPPNPDPQTNPAALLTDLPSAMPLARRLARSELTSTQRDAVLAAAAKLPVGLARDLFEGYLPTPQQGERKLGSNPRPKAILALSGDAERGERTFWSEALNCGKCHKVAERGAAVGPELTSIGKQRTANELLESVLWPSRRVDPKFAQFLIQTRDGQALSGLLIKRDDAAVTLRDAQGKEILVPGPEVEHVRPLHTSIMPDGQLAALTPQEAADLLAYLATRR